MKGLPTYLVVALALFFLCTFCAMEHNILHSVPFLFCIIVLMNGMIILMSDMICLAYAQSNIFSLYLSTHRNNKTIPLSLIHI